MRILYVVSRPLEINTSASVRNKATIQGLLAMGCQVELLTTEPDVNHSAYDESMRIEGVKTILVKAGGTQGLARLGRRWKLLEPLKIAVYRYMNRKNIYDNLAGIVNQAEHIELPLPQYDCIISSSDPKSSHLFVYELLRLQKGFTGRWIQIWGDPFYGDIAFTNKKADQIRAEEHKLISAADRVIYVSELTRQAQKKNYPDCADKMRYVPIPYVEQKEYPLKKLSQADQIELAYCGDYNTNVRNILPLYEYVNQSSRCHLTVCGFSNISLQPTERVTVLPRVGRDKVLKIEENADILVHLSNLKGTQIPGKIYQYSGTNKPILFLLDGDTDKLYQTFSKYERYVFSENTSAGIAEAVQQIIHKENAGYAPVRAFAPEEVAAAILEM